MEKAGSGVAVAWIISKRWRQGQEWTTQTFFLFPGLHWFVVRMGGDHFFFTIIIILPASSTMPATTQIRAGVWLVVFEFGCSTTIYHLLQIPLLLPTAMPFPLLLLFLSSLSSSPSPSGDRDGSGVGVSGVLLENNTWSGGSPQKLTKPGLFSSLALKPS